MPSSEDKALVNDNYDLALQRFEKILLALLERHTHYQKQVMHLAAENKTLKKRLQATKNELGMSSKIDPAAINHRLTLLDDDALARQITAYIKEIDLCLAYFEQA